METSPFPTRPPLRRPFAQVGLLCAGFLLIDLFVPPLIDVTNPQTNGLDAIIFGLAFGVVIGQINLISVWAAFAPGNVLLRVPTSLALVTLVWYVLVLGNRFVDHEISLDDALLLGCILLVGQVAAQTPLWIAANSFGWRLRRCVDDHDAARQRQFNMRQLLFGTTLLAVLLALGRVILPRGAWHSVALWDWEIFVLLFVIVVWNLVIVVPCIWIAFLPPSRRRPILVRGMFIVPVASAFELGVLIMALGAPGDAWFDVFLAFTSMNACQCVTVLGTLALMRWYGFSLNSGAR